MAAFPDDVGQGDCGASLQSELLRRVVLLATIHFIKFHKNPGWSGATVAGFFLGDFMEAN